MKENQTLTQSLDSDLVAVLKENGFDYIKDNEDFILQIVCITKSNSPLSNSHCISLNSRATFNLYKMLRDFYYSEGKKKEAKDINGNSML